MHEIAYRLATPDDIDTCIVIRSLTRENPVSAVRLAELGITSASWAGAVRDGSNIGFIAMDADQPAGFCFGDTTSGEIVVLAVLPEYENRGIGKNLLQRAMLALNQLGFNRLFLGADPRSHIRAHGFYRHLGWVPSGKVDKHGDQELEYHFQQPENS